MHLCSYQGIKEVSQKMALPAAWVSPALCCQVSGALGSLGGQKELCKGKVSKHKEAGPPVLP